MKKIMRRMVLNGLTVPMGIVPHMFLRKGAEQNILAVFNFSDCMLLDYMLKVPQTEEITLLLDSNWECFGGSQPEGAETVQLKGDTLSVEMAAFSAKYYIIKKSKSASENKCS